MANCQRGAAHSATRPLLHVLQAFLAPCHAKGLDAASARLNWDHLLLWAA